MATIPAAQGFDIGSIIQAAQLGRSLNPEVMQQQALGNQLALQLQQLKLQEALDPNIELSRQLNAALATKGLDPASIYRPAEITPTGESLAGITIQNVGALTPQQETLLQARDIAAEQAGIPLEIPRAVRDPRLDVRPVINPFTNQPTPFVTDLSRAIQGATESSNINEIIEAPKRAARLAEVRARYDAMGVPVRVTEDEFGNVQVIPTRMIGGQVPTASAVKTDDGTQLKGKPKAGTGILTQNQQMLTLRKAAESGIDPDDPKYLNPDTGTYDYTRITIDSGKAARENKRLSDAAKASGLSGKTKTEIDALNAADKQLHFLQDEIERIASSGKTPGFWDNVIAASTSAPPSGGLQSIYQQLVKPLQSEESKELEGKKAIISSALTKAISGLNVTKQEAERLGFLPRAGESFDEIVRKAAVLQDYINNQREGLSQGSADPSLGNQPSSTGRKRTKIQSIELEQ